MKYKQKTTIVEALTFEETYDLARAASQKKPLTFRYGNHYIFCESERCYNVPTIFGIKKFTKKDMLVILETGDMIIQKKRIFDQIYERCAE